MSERGKLITFEGADHTGKTTQILLLERALKGEGIDALKTREPGGTIVGEAIREILTDPKFHSMNDRAEALLYEAARAQLCAEVIEPALASGKWVLCDRFIDSTIAYQVHGRGLPQEEINFANEIATCGLSPDLTFVLFASPEAAEERGDEELDRIELSDEAFFTRVQEGYAQMVRENPARLVRVNATCTVAEVHSLVMRAMGARFKIGE